MPIIGYAILHACDMEFGEDIDPSSFLRISCSAHMCLRDLEAGSSLLPGHGHTATATRQACWPEFALRRKPTFPSDQANP